MTDQQTNGHSLLHNGIDDDFEFMNDVPKEDPVLVERRRTRNNEITKKLGAYLLKGYCMLSDACPECDCILLRTPDRQLLCVGCTEVDVELDNKESIPPPKPAAVTTASEQRVTSAPPVNKSKEHAKRSKKRNKKVSVTSEVEAEPHEKKSYSAQLEAKLKWAVNELSKSENPGRINAMCTVIVKLTESIKVLKEYETPSA